MVTADLAPNLLSNYHLAGTGSSAYNLGAANKAVPSYQQPAAPTPYQASGTTPLNAPTTDIDGQARPQLGGFDAGADEFPGPMADLWITKTDGVDSVNQGTTVTYTIVVANAGPLTATGATVTDAVPAALTGATWTCTASAGSSCAAPSGSGSIGSTVTLLPGGSATYTLTGTAATLGSLANTATVAAPAGMTDPNTANNSASDGDTVVLPLPALTGLDNFNRANANNLGTNWSQANTGTNVDLRVNANQAVANQTNDGGQAIWNNPTAGYGSKQGAAFTFANTTLNNSALILKATGGTAAAPSTFLRVRYSTGSGGQVIVQRTTNSGGTYAAVSTFAASFANGDTLTAVANADGSVDAWKTTPAPASVTTYLGHSSATASTGSGRIGIQLQSSNARVDNFSGGTLP